MANPSVVLNLNACYFTSIDLAEFIDMFFSCDPERHKKINQVIHCKLVREDGREAWPILTIYVTMCYLRHSSLAYIALFYKLIYMDQVQLVEITV